MSVALNTFIKKTWLILKKIWVIYDQTWSWIVESISLVHWNTVTDLACVFAYRHHWALLYVSLHFLLMKWTESSSLCWVLSDFTDYLIRSSPQLQIWDTAGQERFRSITQSYYRSANALILTYDITCEDSFRCLPEWLREIEQYANNQVVTILVGEYSSFNEIIFLIKKNCIWLLAVLSQLQYIEWWCTF